MKKKGETKGSENIFWGKKPEEITQFPNPYLISFSKGLRFKGQCKKTSFLWIFFQFPQFFLFVTLTDVANGKNINWDS